MPLYYLPAAVHNDLVELIENERDSIERKRSLPGTVKLAKLDPLNNILDWLNSSVHPDEAKDIVANDGVPSIERIGFERRLNADADD